MSTVCLILKAYPNKDGKMLEEEWDIRHILELLEIEDWEQVPPLKFYLDPMLEAFRELVKVLRVMHDKGPLRMSYYVERNYEMSKRIMELVRQYNIVKRIAGDELKRDQFKFLYSIHEKVYACALREIFLNNKQHTTVMQVVIPELTVFKAMLHIRDVDDRKASDEEKKQKKKEERAALGLSEEEEEELKLDLPQPAVTKKGKKKVEIDPEVIEQARIAALFKKELATYGVSTHCACLLT